MLKSTANVFYNRLLRTDGLCQVQLELTQKCNFSCPHCYLPNKKKINTLSLNQWKSILKELKSRGIIWLGISGGEPLLYPDFCSLYSYAKQLGFVVTVFTNASLLDKQTLDLLNKKLPYAVEVTVNGLSQEVFGQVTGAPKLWEKTFENIKLLKKYSIPTVIKTNLLTINTGELPAIKSWSQSIFGPKRFKYDYVIFPRRDGDVSPCGLRVDFRTLRKTLQHDPDLNREFQAFLKAKIVENKFWPKMYRCNSCLNGVFVDCQGKIKFCLFSDIDCGRVSTSGFAFYDKFTDKLLNIKSKGDCAGCRQRNICFWCPQAARLEIGSVHKKIPYYCRLTKEFIKHTPR
jgi:MoaA/NifB/PqqE/SkfB family radical SAM enzyme